MNDLTALQFGCQKKKPLHPAADLFLRVGIESIPGAVAGIFFHIHPVTGIVFNLVQSLTHHLTRAGFEELFAKMNKTGYKIATFVLPFLVGLGIALAVLKALTLPFTLVGVIFLTAIMMPVSLIVDAIFKCTCKKKSDLPV